MLLFNISGDLTDNYPTNVLYFAYLQLGRDTTTYQSAFAIVILIRGADLQVSICYVYHLIYPAKPDTIIGLSPSSPSSSV